MFSINDSEGLRRLAGVVHDVGGVPGVGQVVLELRVDRMAAAFDAVGLDGGEAEHAVEGTGGEGAELLRQLDLLKAGSWTSDILVSEADVASAAAAVQQRVGPCFSTVGQSEPGVHVLSSEQRDRLPRPRQG